MDNNSRVYYLIDEIHLKVFKDKNILEFINNPDGTTSILLRY